MGTCSRCGNKQDEGKFCSTCGEMLATGADIHPNQHVFQQSQEIAATQEGGTIAYSNESLVRVKETTKTFGTYFKKYLKKPSMSFTKEGYELNHAIISIFLVILLDAISAYTLTSNILQEYDIELSFVEMFGGTTLLNLFFVAIIVFLLFLVNKLFGSGSSFKEIINMYGAHGLTALLLAALSLILVILKAYIIGGLLLFVSFLLIISIIPVYLISVLVAKRSRGIDPFYGYLIYLVAASIAVVIYASKFPDSPIATYIDQFFYYF